MDRSILSRRIRSVGTYLGAFLVLTFLAPVLLLAVAVRDMARRTSFSALRVLILLWLFFFMELLILLRGLKLWLFQRRDPREYMWANWRLQHWWVGFMWPAVRWFFRLRMEVEGEDQFVPGPVLVFSRHASLLDTLIPLFHGSVRQGLFLRSVLKSELLHDPGFEIIGARFPNHFVRRGSDQREQEVIAVGRLAEGLSEKEGVVIFPEGTRFTPEKRARILSKLEERSPEIHRRALRLEHVLPPRLGGPLALLDRAPKADVLFCAHHGLEGFSTLKSLTSGGLVGRRVQVRFWRVPAAEIPRTQQARTDWLLDQWERMEAFVAGQQASALLLSQDTRP